MLKGGGDLVHLDQVVKCLGEGSEDRFHRAGQIGQGFTDGINPCLRCMAHSPMFPRQSLGKD